MAASATDLLDDAMRAAAAAEEIPRHLLPSRLLHPELYTDDEDDDDDDEEGEEEEMEVIQNPDP